MLHSPEVTRRPHSADLPVPHPRCKLADLPLLFQNGESGDDEEEVEVIEDSGEHSIHYPPNK